MNCIFCKISAGDLPCAAVLKTPAVLAFLDIAPVEEGHVLVIPRRHVEQVTGLDDDLLAPLCGALRDVSRRLQSVLSADGISVTQANGACAGQMVAHLHFHLIPRYRGRPMRWAPGQYESPDAMRTLAARLWVET